MLGDFEACLVAQRASKARLLDRASAPMRGEAAELPLGERDRERSSLGFVEFSVSKVRAELSDPFKGLHLPSRALK